MFEEIKMGATAQEAKIIVEVGDYRVTMTGKLEPPNVSTSLIADEYPDDYLTEDNFRSFYGEMKYHKNVNMRLCDPRGFMIERFRWSIPIEVKPRIEE